MSFLWYFNFGKFCMLLLWWFCEMKKVHYIWFNLLYWSHSLLIKQLIKQFILQTGRAKYFPLWKKIKGNSVWWSIYIEESLMTSTEQIPAFKLSNLLNFTFHIFPHLVFTWKQQFTPQGSKIDCFQDMSPYNDKKEVILVFNHVGEAFATAAEANFDGDWYILARAANILQKVFKIFHLIVV